MAVTIAKKWCSQCGGWVKAERHGASHLFHLVMSLITFGIWLIVWFFIATERPFKCSTCGAKTSNRKPWLSSPGKASEQQLALDRRVKAGVGVAAFGVVALIILLTSGSETGSEFTAYEVIVPVANVRQEPSVDAKKVGYAEKGIVLVQPLKIERDWIQFLLTHENGAETIGWIRGDLLKAVEKDGESNPLRSLVDQPANISQNEGNPFVLRREADRNSTLVTLSDQYVKDANFFCVTEPFSKHIAGLCTPEIIKDHSEKLARLTKGERVFPLKTPDEEFAVGGYQRFVDTVIRNARPSGGNGRVNVLFAIQVIEGAVTKSNRGHAEGR